MDEQSDATTSDAPPRARAVVEAALATAIDQYGPALFFDPNRLRDLLAQSTTEAPRAIDLLIDALAEDVPQKLIAADIGELPALLPRLVQRLVKNRGVERGPATWTVRTWAHALALPTKSLDAPSRALPMPVPEPTVVDFGAIVTPLVDRPARTSPVPDPAPLPDPPPAPSHRDAAIVAAAAPPIESTVESGADPDDAPSDLVPLGDDQLNTVPMALLAESPEASPDATPAAEDDRHGLGILFTDVEREAPGAMREPDAVADAPVAIDLDDEPVRREPEPVAAEPVAPATIAAPIAPLVVSKRAFVPKAADAPPSPPPPPAVVVETPMRSGTPLGRKVAIAAVLLVVGVLGIVLMRPFYAPSQTEAPAPTEAPASADSAVPSPAASPDTRAQTDTPTSVTPPTTEPPPPVVADAPAAQPTAPAPVVDAAPAPVASSKATEVEQAPPVERPVPAPDAPAIKRIAVPAAVVGKPFSIAVAVDGDPRRIAAIERHVVTSDTNWPSDTTTSTASALARTKRGAFVVPFLAMERPSTTTLQFIVVDKTGARSASRRVTLRVVPAPAPADTASKEARATQAAPNPKAAAVTCTNATCGSVASSRDVGQAGGVHGYEIIVRMDDRNIRAVVQTNNWKPGTRVRLAGGRFTAVR